jgi:putative copper export protein
MLLMREDALPIYRQLFIAKIILVLCMLIYDTQPESDLVPSSLKWESSHLTLPRSIVIEAIVGLLLLLITAVVIPTLDLGSARVYITLL